MDCFPGGGLSDYPTGNVTEAINFVACDTDSWEQAAVFQLEKLAADGLVLCYARNDRLEFNIPYELYGQAHVYEPDFIVRLAIGINLIVEIKGRIHGETDAKHQVAKRWVAAVNRWSRLGQWDFLVCYEPQALAERIADFVAQRREGIRRAAATLQEAAGCEVARLREAGWTQADFARALRDMLEQDSGS